MDVLIKNFKAPKDCKDCCRLGFSRCPSETSDSLIPSDSGRPIGCPLVELPPHGRLIDADEVQNKMSYYGFRAIDMTIHEFIEDELTTIVEASDE